MAKAPLARSLALFLYSLKNFSFPPSPLPSYALSVAVVCLKAPVGRLISFFAAVRAHLSRPKLKALQDIRRKRLNFIILSDDEKRRERVPNQDCRAFVKSVHSHLTGGNVKERKPLKTGERLRGRGSRGASCNPFFGVRHFAALLFLPPLFTPHSFPTPLVPPHA